MLSKTLIAAVVARRLADEPGAARAHAQYSVIVQTAPRSATP